MGVGFQVSGRYGKRGLFSRPPDGETWLGRVKAWFEANCREVLESAAAGRDSSGRPYLTLRLHPGDEGVHLAVPEAGRVQVSAKTRRSVPATTSSPATLSSEWAASSGSRGSRAATRPATLTRASAARWRARC